MKKNKPLLLIRTRDNTLQQQEHERVTNAIQVIGDSCIWVYSEQNGCGHNTYIEAEQTRVIQFTPECIVVWQENLHGDLLYWTFVPQ